MVASSNSMVRPGRSTHSPTHSFDTAKEVSGANSQSPDRATNHVAAGPRPTVHVGLTPTISSWPSVSQRSISFVITVISFEVRQFGPAISAARSQSATTKSYVYRDVLRAVGRFV